ncbi:MAG: leucine-rich repeat domain-containing protein [Paramuribaculum sp.]|nr:leucine-rich repeat domain-containing protein [Paramuribaculum sp.]
MILIGDVAFRDCDGFTGSLTIGNSVTEIGEMAFSRCSGLKDLILENGGAALKLGADVYSGCPIETLYLGRNLSYEKYEPFNGNKTINAVTIGNSVTEIGKSAFYNCSNLRELTIEDGGAALKLGAGVYSGCPIETLYLGRNLSYEYAPFKYKRTIKSVAIGDSVTEIGESAFEGCEGMNEVQISSLESWCMINFGNVTANPLFYAHNLYLNGDLVRDLVIPEAVSEIKAYAFYVCDFKDILSKAKCAPTIYENSFSDFTYNYSKVSIPQGSKDSYKSKWAKFKHLMPDNPIKKIYTINTPGDLMTQVAMDEVDDIVEIKLIGEINGTDILTMNKMVNLTSIDLTEATIVEGGMPYYEIDNNRFGTQNNTLGYYWAYNLNILTSIQLPESLTSIGDYAFYNLAYLSELGIPKSVTEIGNYAFSGCDSLTSVIIPDSVAKIGKKAFDGCESLTEVHISSLESWCKIDFGDNKSNPLCYAHNLYLDGELINALVIPESISEINSYAFSGCSALTSVSIPNSIISMGSNAFSDCSGLKEVHISSLESWCMINFGDATTNPLYYAHNLYLNDEQIDSLVIPEIISEIKQYAFNGCSSLTSVMIPSSVTTIDNYAFSGCTGINEFTLEDGNTTLSLGNNGNYTDLFSDCPIETLYLGRNLSYSSSYAPFKDKKTLKSVTIGNSVTSIGSSAFSGCSALSTLTLPGSVRSIGSQAFSNCAALTEVTAINPIPAVIESNTFSGCTDQTTLNVPDGSRNIYWMHPFWGKFRTINATVIDSEEEFVEDNVTYHITSELIGTVEVSAANINTKSRAGIKVVIPEEVTYNNQVYTVAGIANNGFEGADISAITLPETISYVGLGAFKGCNNITSVTSLAKLPPSVDASSFDESVYGKATLVVDPSAESAYRNNEIWSKFFTISPTGIEEIEADEESAVRVEGGDIIAPEGSEVYDLNGRRVKATNLAKGIYIVRLGSKAVKVMVK